MLLACDRPEVVERIRHAPRSYIARQQAAAIVRDAVVGARGRPGLMAAVTGVLSRAGLDVDRAAVDRFEVVGRDGLASAKTNGA